MAVTRLRKLLIALLVIAQPASAAFAATAPAFIAPCPVHAALVPVQVQNAPGHEGHAMAGHETHTMHGAPAETPAQPDEGQADPAAFSFACCAAHVVGVLVQNFPIPDRAWTRAPAALIPQPLTSRDLSSVDPPPRILL